MPCIVCFLILDSLLDGIAQCFMLWPMSILTFAVTIVYELPRFTLPKRLTLLKILLQPLHWWDTFFCSANPCLMFRVAVTCFAGFKTHSEAMWPYSTHAKQCLQLSPILHFLHAWHPLPWYWGDIVGPRSVYSLFWLSFGLSSFPVVCYCFRFSTSVFIGCYQHLSLP